MNEFAKNFVDIFNAAAKKSSRAKLFDDFLTCSVAALDRDEQTFATVDNKELHVELFAKLMAALEDCIGQKVLVDHVLGLKLKIPTDSSHKPRYRDILGEIFCELELFDQGGGQVLTPQHMANVMGETTLSPELIRKEINRRGFVTIKENCCGSGALVLGGLNALLEMGINPCRFAFVHASDLDERCIKMTFIQLSLYGIPAVVARQDAITGTIVGTPLVTPIAKFGGNFYGRHQIDR